MGQEVPRRGMGKVNLPFCYLIFLFLFYLFVLLLFLFFFKIQFLDCSQG